MMQRLMMRKNKSCPTCKDFQTPPCYNCTFNMDHPPPNYASLSEQDRCPSYACPSPTRLEHLLPGVPQMDLDSSPYTAEYIMDDTDYEVSTLTQAVGRIGLAVAFLADGRQTETVAVPGAAHTESRSQNLSSPILVPRSTAPTNFPRNCSAPELASQETSVDSSRGRRLSENHLLLTAIASHVSDHQAAGPAPSPQLSNREPSPLPCLLLIPE